MFLMEAIKALVPEGTEFSVEVSQDGTTRTLSENIAHLTDAEIDAKIAELQAEYDAAEYQRTRAEAYPSIQEQLDMQYWDSINGTTTWADAIAQVKADNPKPE